MTAPVPGVPDPGVRRLGLRCEAMLLLGVVWIVTGLGVDMGASHPPNGLLFALLPGRVRGAVWIGTGLWAIIAAARSSRTDSALGALVLMPLFRMVSYLWGWGLWLHPGFDPGEYPDGWYQAGYYLAMIGFVFFVAHIPPALMRTFRSPDAEREAARDDKPRCGGTRPNRKD